MNLWTLSVSLRKRYKILIFQIEKKQNSQKIQLLILSIYIQWLWMRPCVPLQLQTVPELAHHISVTTARPILYLYSSPVYLREIPATTSVINNSMTSVMQDPPKTCSQNIDSKYIPYYAFIFDLAKVLCDTVTFKNFHSHHQMFWKSKFQMHLTVELKQILIPP